MGVAGGGKADDTSSGLATAAGIPRTDGGAKPMPERELTIVPSEATPFEGTGWRPCNC